MTLFCRGLAGLGCVPEGPASDLRVDVTPVDYAADAMLHIALNPKTTPGSTYHIANGRSLTLSELVAAMRRAGAEIKTVSLSEWRDRIAQFKKPSGDGAASFLALCRCLTSPCAAVRHRSLDLFQATDVEFDRRNTEAALAGSGIKCPVPDDELLSCYMAQVFGTEGAS